MNKVQEKITGVAVTADEMTEVANLAIANYQEEVKKTGGTISRSRAIVAILERSQYGKTS